MLMIVHIQTHENTDKIHSETHTHANSETHTHTQTNTCTHMSDALTK
jgi:hypothetical protein